MKIVFDMSSFLWRALLVGKDKEFGYEIPDPEKAGKTIWVNGAQYGYENAVNMMTRVMNEFDVTPIDTIMVFEGMHSKAMRLRIDSEYKASRKARPKELNVEFNKLINMIEKTWLDMGALSARQEKVEADDVVAYLAENLEEDVVVASYDGDMTVLNGVNPHGATVKVWIDGAVGENKYGPFDTKFVTVYKALVGDSSDNIKGVKGFGPAMFEDFVRKYGDEGLQDMIDLFTTNRLEELADHAEACKICARISDQREQAQRSWDLAKMHPEWVNKFKLAKIEWKAGMVRQVEECVDERLKQWYGRSRLVHAGNYDTAMAWALPLLRASKEVALDIETSTPEESDEWLERKAARDKDADKVDVFGSKLASLSLTFGTNNQYTLYLTHRHLEEEGVPNLTSEQIRDFVNCIPRTVPIVIQNLAFELTVLFQEWGHELRNNGAHGFLPNVLDTKLEASYVDENRPLGLKGRSKSTLGYDQTSFAETTTKEGPVGTLPAGGKLLATFDVTKELHPPVYELDPDGQPVGDMIEPGEYEVSPHERRQYKMHELTALEVFDYGTDDTICTIALHNYYRVIMQLEHTWEVYRQVELSAAYLTALAYVQGTPMSLEKMRELEKEDDAVYDESWTVVRQFLIEKGWDGSVPPTYGVDITPAQVKEAFQFVFDRPLDTMMRKLDKLVAFIRAEDGCETFASLLEGVTDEAGAQRFTDYVRVHFKGEPDFNTGSPKQLQKFMYETMGLPIRLFNKPTDKMRSEGKKVGTPKTDDLAVQYALKYDAPEKPEIEAVLDAFRRMKMVQTRRGLYYKPYAVAAHWKDGLLHPSHNQCATNTRRYSASDPNDQQLPKHPKATGEPARFREVYVPHKPGAVVVSLDFNSQELRVIADYSQDANMLSCYVGDNLKDMHALTALGIIKRREPAAADWSYDDFVAAMEGERKGDMKVYRALGKKTNFTTEYGAMAPKLAQTLLVSEEEAQSYIDAKLEAFPQVQVWKDGVQEYAAANGYVTTMMGARRHLAEALESDDGYERSKAERQAVNFKVQGSSAEMTKLGMGRMWDRGIPFKFDCRFIAPVHDEVVWSVMLDQLLPFLQEVHACMVAPYANMQVPIVSSISFGPSFGEQIEIGEEPTAEAVEAGLVKYREMLGEAVPA